MQVRLSIRGGERGTVILTALFIMTMLGLGLATYLQLTVNQNQLTTRSEIWNACMPVVEAGLEESLAHCTRNSTNMVSNGWTLSSGRYRLTNTVGLGFYEVSIGTNVPYEVIATGYYPMVGTSTYISRTVQVTTQMDPLLSGVVARISIGMGGTPSRIDSYDSRNPAKSTNGAYDSAKRTDKADVACLTVGGFDIKQGDIYGRAAVPPGGTVDYGSQGKVGNAAWQASGNKGIQPGALRTDLNQSMPPVVVPFSSGMWPAPGMVNGKWYQYVLDGGNFTLPDIDDEDVAVTATSSIYVSGNLRIDDLLIKTNCTIKFYVGGESARFGDIDNQTRTSTTLLLYGLPALTDLHLGNDWAGGIYAPNADMSGGGHSGAAVVRSFNLNGNGNYHYDEAFSAVNPVRAWVVNSWKEM